MTFQAVCNILNTLNAGVSMLDSFMDIRHTIKYKNDYTTWQMVHRIGTDVLSCCAEGANVVATHRESTSHETKVKLSSAAGVADVAKQTSRVFCKPSKERGMDDVLNIVTCMTWRIGVVAANVHNLPKLSQESKDLATQVANTATVVNVIENLVANREKIEKATLFSVKKIKALITTHKPEAKVNIEQSGDVISLKVDSQTSQEIQEVLSIKDIKSCTKIPRLYRNSFNTYQCGITGEPIRFIVVVRGTTEPDRNPCVYEKQAIFDFLTQYPGKTPDGWPGDISFDKNLLIPFRSAQKTIDERLKESVEGLQRNFAELPA